MVWFVSDDLIQPRGHLHMIRTIFSFLGAGGIASGALLLLVAHLGSLHALRTIRRRQEQ
jgi:hypothetical protein